MNQARTSKFVASGRQHGGQRAGDQPWMGRKAASLLAALTAVCRAVFSLACAGARVLVPCGQAPRGVAATNQVLLACQQAVGRSASQDTSRHRPSEALIAAHPPSCHAQAPSYLPMTLPPSCIAQVQNALSDHKPLGCWHPLSRQILLSDPFAINVCIHCNFPLTGTSMQEDHVNTCFKPGGAAHCVLSRAAGIGYQRLV